MNPKNRWSDAMLDQSRFQGDSLADHLISGMLQPWQKADSLQELKGNFHQIQKAFLRLKSISTNADLDSLVAEFTAADFTSTSDLTRDVFAQLAMKKSLPVWADLKKIERTEQLFENNSFISGILFFCASLPEVYVVPDISSVLHATGSLEKMAAQRIRTTAAMILSVLLKGGLSKPEGVGRVKILKARFVHAVMRNIFLRGNPTNYANNYDEANMDGINIISPITLVDKTQTTHPLELAYLHGWNPANEGVPCNQEELAYTLLTFSFVYLRSLRRLGLGFSKSDEECYLHCWNVIGHILGIEDQMMPHTMDEADILFQTLQSRARAKPLEHDPRPLLGNALLSAIEKAISPPILKPVAALIVRYLTSERTAEELGLHLRLSWLAKSIFFVLIHTMKTLDLGIRIVKPGFSIVRFVLRFAGYKLILKVLTDPADPVDLPDHIRAQINALLGQWESDQHTTNILSPRFFPW